MERYLKEVLGTSEFGGVCKTRSKTMAAIRSKGNKSTELRLRMALVRARIGGWTMHDRTLPGTPDFYFDRAKIAVFVDGCFWHGCPRCGHTPKTRSEFWIAKFQRNQERDIRTARLLQKANVRVIRFWEHQILTIVGLERAIVRVQKTLDRRHYKD
jgi:DNA mismatch endonuclease (patch repair protein)